MKARILALPLSLVAALLVAACAPNLLATAPAPATVTAETGSAPLVQTSPSQPVTDPLPSWNEGPAKTSILKFIADVTNPGGPEFVPPAERIVVSDNDGTLWTEKPIPAQMAFVFARIQQMAKDHPEWATTEPYAAILAGDQAAIEQFTPAQIEELVYTTHAGMSPEEFESIVKDFLGTALHPRFNVRYTQTVYQPLLELLDLLRANDFQPYIVSGGGVDFMRAFADEVYGIPTDDVVGSGLQYGFEQTSPITGDLIREAEMVTFDDKEMKPVNIQRHIGKRPIMAIGNSDGDLAMFQYTGGGKLPFLNLLIVHDDAEREYDDQSGTDAVMTAASQSPWMFVSMKRDFKTVFPPASPASVTQPSTAGWLTYTNPAGFSTQYPSTWNLRDLLPTTTAQGVALSGAEGTVELWWGTGFGGACPQGYSTVKVAGGELPACHTVGADGIQHWEQINKELATTSFSGRAYTADGTQASADAVLVVLATLAFQEPAAPARANPASENCVAQGGKLQIEQRGDDGQVGVCYFEDNLQCEEWALMRGECPVGGVKVTGFATPAGRYCAITGGTYAVSAYNGQADEQGTCTLPGGMQCDATEFYNGRCDAATGKMPNTSGLALVPPASEVCNSMAQALAEALLRANAQKANVEVTQSDEPVPMTDVATGAEGTACRSTGTGTGEQFASPDAFMQQISAVLTGGGWVDERQQTSSGGATGEGWGFRSGDLAAYASVSWHPDASANCPKDQPIPECKVTPAQQLYTITLDTAQTVKQAPLQGAQAAPAPRSNPAAQNCINVGGTPKTETRPDGGQYSVCYFGDNYVCEQWALMHGECPVGGVKVTGYNTPAARYCAITGGTYTVIGTTNTGAEAGNCTLPSGKVCDADAYFNGTCSSSGPEPATPTAPIGKPNPSSQYCTAVGGSLKIEQRDDVGQMGVCYFPDNKQCEEWALERGDCPVGGVKVTGYNTPAARYCAITGGKYTASGTTPDGQEAGSCALPSGEVCDAWPYYNGYCGTSY